MGELDSASFVDAGVEPALMMPRAVLPMIERNARSKKPSCSASRTRGSSAEEFFIASAVKCAASCIAAAVRSLTLRT